MTHLMHAVGVEGDLFNPHHYLPSCDHRGCVRISAPIRSSFRVDDEFLEAVGEEVGRARAKFPSSNLVFVALVEEVGELAEALLKRAAGKDTDEHVKAEAVQVAAMALRCTVEGDPSFKNYSEP